MVSDRSTLFLRSATALLALSASVTAFPAGRFEERSGVGFFDDVLLFDAPAVLSDPPRIQIEAYTYLRQFDIDLGPLTDLFGGLFDGIDLGDIGEKAGNIAERVKLLASIPRTGKQVEINIPGCGATKLTATSNEIDGISITDLSCAASLTGGAPIEAQVDLDSRGMTAKIFPSPIDGFGVISDVDDTIKISNVLNKLELIKNTFIEEPKAVAGMPELYASLKTSLNDPLFSYISGSPFQLDKLNTYKHKVATIDRLVNLYPQKKFLMIGDSTEQDPEVYAEAFKRHATSVQCIWIRLVDGADNSKERFAKTFDGVHGLKIRTFTDAETQSLQQIDVANGKC
ncbi:hypothetical protein BKA62DRAFT_707946 [Auriculariales sp. MPI-PUGE-AT-0066]|nr:hypothetical protein BKA62DRAFT_707946 [Auriculariales sp. MPI-PUGE-AT-0066]